MLGAKMNQGSVNLLSIYIIKNH